MLASIVKCIFTLNTNSINLCSWRVVDFNYIRKNPQTLEPKDGCSQDDLHPSDFLF